MDPLICYSLFQENLQGSNGPNFPTEEQICGFWGWDFFVTFEKLVKFGQFHLKNFDIISIFIPLLLQLLHFLLKLPLSLFTILNNFRCCVLIKRSRHVIHAVTCWSGLRFIAVLVGLGKLFLLHLYIHDVYLSLQVSLIHLVYKRIMLLQV